MNRTQRRAQAKLLRQGRETQTSLYLSSGGRLHRLSQPELDRLLGREPQRVKLAVIPRHGPA